MQPIAGKDGKKPPLRPQPACSLLQQTGKQRGADIASGQADKKIGIIFQRNDPHLVIQRKTTELPAQYIIIIQQQIQPTALQLA